MTGFYMKRNTGRGVSREGFATSQPVRESKFLSHINKKLKTFSVILSELSPTTISNTIDKYIIITFSVVNNPYPYHP